ncbi:MAG: hypothetical protein WCP85_19345 [Mariniphaga sp.]
MNYKTEKISTVILITFFLFSLTACAKKVSFLTSSTVPAARGYVKINQDKNKNFDIQIRLSGLAEVQRLQPAKQGYVVWMISQENIAKNIGRLISSSGFFSKSLKASFETVSSLKPIKIFITAEEDINIQYPAGLNILTTNQF